MPRAATIVRLATAAAVLSCPITARADERDECLARARTEADILACPAREPEPEPIEVTVRAKPPPRSASDWEADAKTVAAAPHQSAADVLGVAPGVFVSDRGLPGRAPHLSLRGFDGTSGQDVEIFAGNIPLNQVSHLRAPGYADMRLVMPEVIRAVRIAHGPYDPRQGDFAVAGSVRMDLGLAPGFWAKGGIGSFGGRRVFLAFAPRSKELSDTFAAFETDSTHGPGGARGGERSSFVGQLGGGGRNVQFKGTVAIGSARFDFPGFLEQSFVERGGDPYAAREPLGRDRSSQALIGGDVVWSVGEGTLGIGAYAGKTRTTFHQNLTGFVLDALAGAPELASDDSEQVNDAGMVGLTVFYRHAVPMTSKRDAIELGVSARVDTIDQTETRLFADGTKNSTLVDATIDATNISAYADLSLYPVRRLVVRGGPRLDSLSYGVEDRTGDAGLDRTAQGFHLGNKVTADLSAGAGVHLVASYGEGFRSPQARDLKEGERVPFASARSVEGGLRLKQGSLFQASAVAFGSWLGHDRVFDATARQNVEAPPSVRAGGAGAVAVRSGPIGTSVSATYTRAEFTGGDATFAAGDPVPYAPALVLRADTYLGGRLGKVAGSKITGRLGFALEGAAGRPMPGGGEGKALVSVDGLAALGWRGVELALNGTNLLDQRHYDSQYVYVASFDGSPTLPAPSRHVLVAAPTTVFLTLQIRVRGAKADHEQREEKRCLLGAQTEEEEDACRD